MQEDSYNIRRLVWKGAHLRLLVNLFYNASLN